MDFGNINTMKHKLQDLAGSAQGLSGSCTSEYRPRLVDRVRAQASQSHREAQKAAAMIELSELLEKNPDVARIFELMGEFQG